MQVEQSILDRIQTRQFFPDLCPLIRPLKRRWHLAGGESLSRDLFGSLLS